MQEEMGMTSGWISRIATWSVVALFPGLLLAATARDKVAQNSPSETSATTVEMFAAMKEGQIEVKLIPKDSSEARVLITNKTDQPLSIKLPSTFAGVPVLAQALGGGGGRGGNQSQSTGGGMDGGLGGGGGGGGGFFNIAPEKVGQLKVATVCLEHGKKEPHAAVPYEIKPLEEVSQKPEVQELCRMLGAGKIPQRVAQVAAWHLNNDMSWDQLANKQLRFANGSTAPYFSRQEIQGAIRVVAVAYALVQEKKSAQPTSEKKGSLSQ